ncbi:putative membrane protein [Halobacteriovorax marinus SJ]|uniref:3-deoxy-D-manno-octulosonic acid transferase n=1 Tax=Halobacteriovorax marinus (strain ATCC BAA-682 / DSM 15412 / SJ) TaxID=862908 RepID=E1X1Y8_HALMS|nr:glycosyltransferase N-terminal domain-containing protein [Halobacteriovorax marinus]CBW26648.1 putative membrane protein [Halobacteriovorax marinus SJ]
MMLNTYLSFQRFALLFQWLIAPFFELLALFVGPIKNRKAFELSKKIITYKDRGISASHCFHVSSEGELEQAMPLITHFLEQGLYIELVYTSPSVDRKCTELAKRYERLNILPLPLMTIYRRNFSSWVTAKSFFMCRYDFFSELMLYGARSDVRFTLLSASLKGKKLSGLNRIFYRALYNCFDYIIAASEIELKNFNELRLKSKVHLRTFEMRLLQISKRISNSKTTIESSRDISNFFSQLQAKDVQSNFIIGSAWPVDLDILRSSSLQEKILSGELTLVIAPHSLSSSAIAEILSTIEKLAPTLSSQVIDENTTLENGYIYINKTPGVLLESYCYFGHVLVGGGHGRSIHSVLEPFLCGARIYCGPKIFRSTEFDFTKEISPSEVIVVEDLSKITSSISEYNREYETAKRRKVVAQYEEGFQQLMDLFRC